MKKKILIIFCTLVFFALTATSIMSGTAGAKSLYVIADINSSPTPIQAYDIQAGGVLVYQATHNVPSYDGGAVGIAIDTDSKMLFITYENSNIIQMVNAETMEDEGSTTAPGAYNLAGIVVDQEKQKIYTVDRNTNHLYVYSWDPVNKTLTLDGGTWTGLSGVSQTHGIALDEVHDLLYVGDLTTTVKIFNTSDWSSASSFSVSQKVMGIAVDVTNGFVYTGNALEWSGYDSLGLICKYDLNTGNETTVNISMLTGATNDNVVGLAVDPATSLLYITTGNQAYTYEGSDLIMIFDSDLNLLNNTGDIGDPTGLCIPGKDISYNPLNLSKDDRIEECVNPGDEINYTICFENPYDNLTVTNITLEDTLPDNVSFVNASDDGVYDGDDHAVTWSFDTLGPSSGQCVWLLVEVNSTTPLGASILNYVTVESDQLPPTTKTEITLVCETNDTTPPVTTKIIGVPQYEDGLWVNLSTPITLNATDPGENATGVKEIRYIIDGNETIMQGNEVTFWFEEECNHTLEFWAVDNANNEENHTIQYHYVDDTGPNQTVKLGEPKNMNAIYYEGTWYPGIGIQTPIWINSTDVWCMGGVGSDYLTYELYWGEEFGEWTLIETVTVYDNDTNDINPEDGNISVKLYMDESCWHEIHYWCYDNLGNREPKPEESFLNIDFIVDGDEPTTSWYYLGPKYGQFISCETQKIIHANDTGCIPGGSGVQKIDWKVDQHIGGDVWIVVKSGTVYDNDGNDSDETPGEIEIAINIDEECEHHIYHQATDNVGNVGEEYKQYVKVDCTPPDIEKTVGTPQYTEGLEEGEYFVTSNTPIWINATDNGTDPCIVGSVYLTVTVEYQGAQTQYYTVYVEDGTASIGPIFLLGDCIHYVNVTAIDNLENTRIDNEIFYVDNTPPQTPKEIGEPKYAYAYDIFVTTHTPIWLNTTDYTDPCAVGCEYLHWEIWWKNQSSELWELKDSDNESSNQAELYFTEECEHKIVWWAVDYLGNKECGHSQLHKVDDTPPDIEKTVGTPQYTEGLEEGEYFVTSNTPIWINATDNGTDPCIVGSVYLTVTVEYQGAQTQYYTVYVEDGTASIGPIFLLGDCIHYVNVTAIDNLENTRIDNEIFYVDNTPPETPKEIGNPQYEDGDWVTTNTPIWLNTTDYDEPCAVGCEYLHWEIWWKNQSSELWELKDSDNESSNQAELYFTEECEHAIVWWAVDYLNNSENAHLQFHYVDDTPPDIEKDVGQPQYTEGLEEGEYFVTSNTPIWINATDNGTDPCIVGSVNLTVGVWYNGSWTYYYDEVLEGTAHIGPIYLLGDCIHYVNITARDDLENTRYHNETFYVDNTPPESVKTFNGSTYEEDLNENGTIEPEEENYWVTSETEITITSTDEADPCAVGVAGFHVTIWWDSDCDDDVDTLLFDEDIDDPYNFTFTFKELQEDNGNYEYIEGLYMIGWNSTDLLGNEEQWTEQYHKVDDTPPHILIIKPVDGWYKDGSGIPSVVFAEDLTNPHGPCGPFDNVSVGIEDGKQGGGFLIDIFPNFSIIPLGNDNFIYHAASHEFIGNLVIPNPSGIPDGAVLFVANASDNLGNGANSLLEVLHAYFIQAMLSGSPYEVFGDLIADFIASKNIVWIGIDNTPPSVTITDPIDGQQIGPDTVNVSADMGDMLSGITSGSPCYIKLDGITLGVLPYNNGVCQGTLLIPSNMPSGPDKPLNVSVFDVAGNAGYHEISVYLIDQETGYIPTVNILNPANGTTHEGTITVEIEAHDQETNDSDLDVVVRVNRQYDPPFLYQATYDNASGHFFLDIDVTKYQDGAKLELQAFATDEDYNSGSSAPIIVFVQSTIVYDQWLSHGWNSLILPFNAISCNNSIERVLASIDGHYDLVYHFNGGWLVYIYEAPWNFLTQMSTGKQYWINITKTGGIRYYSDTQAPSVTINAPINNSILHELDEINGTATDDASGVEDVVVQIYDDNTDEYWTGYEWGTQTNLECIGTTSWSYGSSGVNWSVGHNYTITAIVTDRVGCHGYDMASFSMTGYTISGTVYLNESIALELGDTLLVAYNNYDEWPPSGPEGFLIAENITDPVMPFSYDFDVFNGSYYVVALLVNVSGESPYAAGAAYNVTPDDLLNVSIGPDKIVVAGADVPDQDITLYLIENEP